MSQLKIAFMGTPDFAVPILESIVAAGHDVAVVYTQPPRPAGRGKAPRPTAIAEAAAKHGIAVRTPTTLKDAEEHAAFAALGLDAAVVAAYGLILPREILDAPRLGCINAHASILPRWRGAAPIQRAILAGDDETGVSIMAMDEGLDTGPIYRTERVPISRLETATTLHDKLANLSAQLIPDVLAALAAGTLLPAPQPEEGATYAAKIQKTEAQVDWAAQANDIDRLVRAMNPFPGAWFEASGERIKIFSGEVISRSGGERSTPGEVVDDVGTVACGTPEQDRGAYRPLRVQRGGRDAVDMAAFLRGFSLPKGTLLKVRES